LSTFAFSSCPPQRHIGLFFDGFFHSIFAPKKVFFS
jgi:hypothetical protein